MTFFTQHILKNLRKLIPTLKKEMTRREFISLKMFTYIKRMIKDLGTVCTSDICMY